jgi:hypothetical protein
MRWIRAGGLCTPVVFRDQLLRQKFLLSMKMDLLCPTSLSTWLVHNYYFVLLLLLPCIYSLLKNAVIDTDTVQVVVPLSSFIPFPYSSTAHLPTHYVHRLVSKLNMSLWAQVQQGRYPSSPPGEAAWPSFLQVYYWLFAGILVRALSFSAPSIFNGVSEDIWICCVAAFK